MSALDVQVGGDHYKKYKIQPMEYSMANGLDACQHTAIKYITRFRDKGGIADLEKAKHCIDLLIEFERKALGALAVGVVFDDLLSGGSVAKAMNPPPQAPSPQPWLPHAKGANNPARRDQMVDVTFANGETDTGFASGYVWTAGTTRLITHWRPHTPV